MCGVDGSKEKVDKPGKVPVAEFALKGGSGAFDSEGLWKLVWSVRSVLATVQALI